MELTELVEQAKKTGRPFALVTLIECGGSTPRHQGAKMVVFPDGDFLGTVGGGPLEAHVIEEAKQALLEGRPRKVRTETARLGMYCGGWAEFFVDVTVRPVELVLLGGGHVALALSRVADAVRMPYTVVDDREEYSSRERFPNARAAITAHPRAAFDQVAITPETYLIILTRCHAFDFTCLALGLKSRAGYLGLIGSQIKVMKIFRRLERLAYQPRSDERVHAPIGVQIGNNTPEEIAVSIMAEVLLVKSGGVLEKNRDLFRKGLLQVIR